MDQVLSLVDMQPVHGPERRSLRHAAVTREQETRLQRVLLQSRTALKQDCVPAATDLGPRDTRHQSQMWLGQSLTEPPADRYWRAGMRRATALWRPAGIQLMRGRTA